MMEKYLKHLRTSVTHHSIKSRSSFRFPIPQLEHVIDGIIVRLHLQRFLPKRLNGPYVCNPLVRNLGRLGQGVLHSLRDLSDKPSVNDGNCSDWWDNCQAD